MEISPLGKSGVLSSFLLVINLCSAPILTYDLSKSARQQNSTMCYGLIKVNFWAKTGVLNPFSIAIYLCDALILTNDLPKSARQQISKMYNGSIKVTFGLKQGF
jgi:hypothetical protein